ncbi:hypothetical protein ACX80V_04650 [Arthrobacter sp. MDT3-24]
MVSTGYKPSGRLVKVPEPWAGMRWVSGMSPVAGRHCWRGIGGGIILEA